MTAEHLHAALNHVPVIGVPMLIAPLLYALVRRDPHTLGVSLALLIALAVSARVVMWSGEQAAERYNSGPPRAFIDETGLAWIGAHEERAEIAAFTLYLVGAGAIAGLVVVIRKRRAPRAIAIGALAGCVLCTGLFVWCAQAGGKVRHPEFRATPTEQPPASFGWHDDEDH